MRMLEKDYIQLRGFHNLKKDGKVVGFQFCLRTDYYRGLFLSQIRFGKVIVDGVEYRGDQVIWCIGGVDYYPSDMAELGNVFWHNQELATIKIMKEGGLEQGYHDIEIRWGHVASYIPPEFDEIDFEAPKDRGEWAKRRLILV